MDPDQWSPGSYGAGKRHWHVCRKKEGQPQEQLRDRREHIRWFGSFEAARKAADKANAKEEG